MYEPTYNDPPYWEDESGTWYYSSGIPKIIYSGLSHQLFFREAYAPIFRENENLYEMVGVFIFLDTTWGSCYIKGTAVYDKVKVSQGSLYVHGFESNPALPIKVNFYSIPFAGSEQLSSSASSNTSIVIDKNRPPKNLSYEDVLLGHLDLGERDRVINALNGIAPGHHDKRIKFYDNVISCQTLNFNMNEAFPHQTSLIPYRFTEVDGNIRFTKTFEGSYI